MILRFFRSLRGKLILTYTLVTVLALLALETLVLLVFFVAAQTVDTDREAYLGDVYYVLTPQAAMYLQPGEEDLPGLQIWAERIYDSGYASLEPIGWGDSPAAVIVKSDPLVVLSPDGIVLVQAPYDNGSLVGRSYSPPAVAGSQEILENAYNGITDPLALATESASGDILTAVPIFQKGRGSDLVGVIVVTVEPPPSVWMRSFPVLLVIIFTTAVMLLIGVAPFGALFGFIMSHGLTRRLKDLTQAVNSWSEGDFSVQPSDRSQDEIGYLGRRMRRMAEHIQSLLQTKQELAMLEERNRLARDLHDTVKQQAFASLMQVRAAKNLLEKDPLAARQHLEDAEELIKSSQHELGWMIAELRPAALDGQGLARALENYLNNWSQHTRITTSLQVLSERQLPLDVEQALYRVAQEALANIARHSRASQALLTVDYRNGQVCLEVVDNGIGFDPKAAQAQGFGLQSMRERVIALGGNLQISSTKDQGTAVTVVVPLTT